MRLANKIKTLFSFDRVTVLLLAETFFYLGWARFLKSRPFSKTVHTLGTPMSETSFNTNLLQNVQLNRISFAIHVMSRYTFWESQCFVKAIAGMKMLERRKIESTLYLGTAKDESGQLIAHAWLRSGSFFISGKEEMRKFTIVSKFANGASAISKGENDG